MANSGPWVAIMSIEYQRLSKDTRHALSQNSGSVSNTRRQVVSLSAAHARILLDIRMLPTSRSPLGSSYLRAGTQGIEPQQEARRNHWLELELQNPFTHGIICCGIDCCSEKNSAAMYGGPRCQDRQSPDRACTAAGLVKYCRFARRNFSAASSCRNGKNA